MRMLRGDRERRRHLHRRLAQLCRALPVETVQAFLWDLIDNDAATLAWRLLVDIRTSGIDFGRCLQRILRTEEQFDEQDPNDLPRRVLSQMAHISTNSSNSALFMHAALWEVLPGKNGKQASFAAKCALLLPVYCIQTLDRMKVEEAAPAMTRLIETFGQPLNEDCSFTLKDYWVRALSDTRLPSILRECPDLRTDWRNRALVLLQLSRTAPEISGDSLKPLLTEIKAQVAGEEWRDTRRQWQAMKDLALDLKAKEPITPANALTRRFLLEAISACNKLLTL